MDRKNYRFTLEKGSKKYHCPNPPCGKKEFKRYIDTETGDYLPEQYGRCNRVDNCGYHVSPYKDGYASQVSGNKSNHSAWRQPAPSATIKAKPKVFVPAEILRATISGYDENVFVQNLLTRIQFPVSVEDIKKVISLYCLGTISEQFIKQYRPDIKSKYKPLQGAISFPYLESRDRIHAMQLVQYGADNKRKYFNWIDSYLSPNENRDKTYEAVFPMVPYVNPDRVAYEWIEARRNQSMVDCYFGAHLVNNPDYKNNPIALVEGPKSAIIGMLYFGFPDEHPDNFLWLATGSLGTFTLDRSKILKGRKVKLFPDLSPDGSTYNKWRSKAIDFKEKLPGTNFTMYSYFEETAPQADKNEGNDIADYLVQFDWRTFRDRHKQDTKPSPQIQPEEKQPIPPAEIIKTLESRGYIVDRSQPEKLFHSDDWQMSYVKPGAWNDEINELDQFLSNATFPEVPFYLNPFTPIGNIKAFLAANLEVARHQNGNPTYRPYLDRVIELVEFIETGNE